MARRYVMTAKRRAALRKAQLASARKRRRTTSAPARAARNRRYKRRAVAVGKVAVQGVAISTLVIGPVATARLTKSAAKSPYKAGKLAHSYGKGFARGYKQSRNRHSAAQRNWARAGGTRIERAPQLALTARGSRQTRGQRRRY